jgi:hypothetical protein
MRVLGIASGVLLSELSSVLIFPRTATQVSWAGCLGIPSLHVKGSAAAGALVAQEAVAKMGVALAKLAELNTTVWMHGPFLRPPTPSAKTP